MPPRLPPGFNVEAVDFDVTQPGPPPSPRRPRAARAGTDDASALQVPGWMVKTIFGAIVTTCVAVTGAALRGYGAYIEFTVRQEVRHDAEIEAQKIRADALEHRLSTIEQSIGVIGTRLDARSEVRR